jgi:hypothetical protein
MLRRAAHIELAEKPLFPVVNDKPVTSGDFSNLEGLKSQRFARIPAGFTVNSFPNIDLPRDSCDDSV